MIVCFDDSGGRRRLLAITNFVFLCVYVNDLIGGVYNEIILKS